MPCITRLHKRFGNYILDLQLGVRKSVSGPYNYWRCLCLKKKNKFVSLKKVTIPYVTFVRKYSTEYKARKYLEELRRSEGIVCPFCGERHVYDQKRNGTRGYYRCSKCQKVFTVRTGTVFERSHVPLTKWMYAFYKVITFRKGYSSIQLALEIGVTQKTAWFMLQRVRHACEQNEIDADKMLKGVVEADAAYFGGKEKSKHESKKQKKGRGAVGKTAVLGAKERGGRVSARVILDTGKEMVHDVLKGMVNSEATLMTDEHKSYEGVPFKNHKVVHHALKEFVNDMAYTNGIESVWAVLKRGWIGVYHHFSPKHLQLYVNEFCFRLNEGKCETKLKERIKYLCGFSIQKKHLTFKELLSRDGDNGLLRAA